MKKGMKKVKMDQCHNRMNKHYFDGNSNHSLDDEMTGIDAQNDPEFISEGDVYETDECIFDKDIK